VLPGDRPTRRSRDISRKRPFPAGDGQSHPWESSPHVRSARSNHDVFSARNSVNRTHQNASAATNGLVEARREMPRQARWPRGLLVLAVVGLIVVAFAQTAPGHGLLRLAGLAQPPPAYTALYFTNSQGLPTSLPTGRVEVPVSFTVQNSSSQAKTYQWKLEVENGKSTTQVGGQLSVLGDATAVEAKSVKAVCRSGSGLLITVSLAGTAESIDYRVVCSA
jgi:hypothetical protein